MKNDIHAYDKVYDFVDNCPIVICGVYVTFTILFIVTCIVGSFINMAFVVLFLYKLFFLAHAILCGVSVIVLARLNMDENFDDFESKVRVAECILMSGWILFFYFNPDIFDYA